MGIFGNFFGSKQSSEQDTVMSQLPAVESAVGHCIADFKDRTKLSYAYIFPIMQAIAVKLYVQDFGLQATRLHYEQLVKSLTADGSIREDQFKSFASPEIPPEDLPHTTELNALLWKLANDLVARGIKMETVSGALVNISLRAATKSVDPYYAAGLLMTSIKELRASDARPQAFDNTDEDTKVVFDKLRDLVCDFRDRSGLEWEHLLPGIQRVAVIHCIRYRGKERAVELFQVQLKQLDPLIEQAPPRKSPLRQQITPLHITNMAKFNEYLFDAGDKMVEIVEIHPVFIAQALSMLVTVVASTHYDVITLKAIIASACMDIENGKYDFVKRTHS